MAAIEQAVSGWRAALGAAAVSIDPRELAHYGMNMSEFAARELDVVLRPTSLDDVRSVIDVARATGVRVHPISTGRNWGFGSALPARGPVALVDLGGMDRIVDVDSRFRYAVIEPGVTQGQLAEHLTEQGSRLKLNVTGAGTATSIVGNVLDRGCGNLGARMDDLLGVEAVLGNGGVVRTGLWHLPSPGPVVHHYPPGLGPDLRGLFVQSGFGIVTKIVLRLHPVAPLTVVTFEVAQRRLAAVVDALWLAREDGVITGHLRITDGTDPIIRYFGNSDPAVWKVQAVLGGTRNMRAEAVRELRRRLDDSAGQFTAADTEEEQHSPENPQERLLAQARLGLVNGTPSDRLLNGFADKTGRTVAPGSVDLDRDRELPGMLCANVAVPFAGDQLAACSSIVRSAAEKARMPTSQLYERAGTTALFGLFPFYFDRRDADAVAAAHAYKDLLLRRLESEGIYPVRMDVDSIEQFIARTDDDFRRCVTAIKRALDPQDIISGRHTDTTESVATPPREQVITAVAETAAASAGENPYSSLPETIARRLESLSRTTRDLLPMVALLGPSVDVTEVAAVLSVPVMEVWSAVTEAMDSGLLTHADSELVFRPNQIREILSERLPASLRSDLLRRAGQALQATGAPIERIAYYLSLSDSEPDHASIAWLADTADRLIVRAPDLAVRLLHRAATVADLDAAVRSRMVRARIRALLWSGRAAEAEAVLRATLHNPGHDDEAELRWLLAQACQAQGRLTDAVSVAETTLSTMDLGTEHSGRFLGMCALNNFFLERFDAAERTGQRAISLGERGGDPLATGYGLMAVGAVRYTEGHLDEALEMSSRIRTVCADGTGSDQFDPYALYAHCLVELDRLTDAEAALKTAIGHNRRTRGVYLSPNLMAKARLHLLDGRWDDALSECAAVTQVPDMLGYAPIAQHIAALIGVHRGTVLPGPESLPAPDGRLGSTEYAQFGPWVTALVHESRGRRQQALDVLVSAYRERDGGMTTSTLYYIYPDIARLAVDVGDIGAARAVADAAAELLLRQPTASRQATALLCGGMADHAPDNVCTAARLFRQAGRPLYEAQALENAAVLLAAAGHRTKACQALDSAVELYTLLGASWDSARAVARVRPHGIRRGVRGPRNRPKSGWAALTETERKVAGQVAAGLSNAEIAAQMFLSHRTIQSHVSSILTKLDVRSRREIADRIIRSEP
ncbi:FAD-binding protein [Nocardia wallacei]|uniref:FAD-binding protein n=1 Tax=Nocardia wallacei TaxID=480035 RepID=UPI002457D9CD|nr:FAD-binding protein [Nocardia wallacei]